GNKNNEVSRRKITPQSVNLFLNNSLKRRAKKRAQERSLLNYSCCRQTSKHLLMTANHTEGPCATIYYQRVIFLIKTQAKDGCTGK
ncbi:hypothetical protein, partial [uncultured Microscilla sp.]|uniref:hypothetical protein n=1 Tax=uncultured Microscilla sp. TaxID=432653 RepID=UPI0026271396